MQYLEEKEKYESKIGSANEVLAEKLNILEKIKKYTPFSRIIRMTIFVLFDLWLSGKIVIGISGLCAKLFPNISISIGYRNMVEVPMYILIFLLLAWLVDSSNLRNVCGGDKKLMKMKYRERCREAENEVDKFDNYIEQIIQEKETFIKHNKPNSILPSKYWKKNTLSYIISYLEDGRADSLKEAMNLYELHADNAKERKLIEKHTERMDAQLDSLNEKVDDIRLSQFLHNLDHLNRS